MVFRNRGGVHHKVRAADIFCTMSDGNAETVCPERLNRFILHAVRTGYGIAPLPQDPGKTGHAGPSDADHVNVGSRKRMNIVKGLLHHSALQLYLFTLRGPSTCLCFVQVLFGT